MATRDEKYEPAEEWRQRVLGDSDRLKKALEAAKARRERMKQEEEAPPPVENVVDTEEMEELDKLQDKLRRNNTRLLERYRGDSATTENQLAKLKLAEEEFARTNQRISELHVQVAETEDFDEDKEELEGVAEEGDEEEKPQFTEGGKKPDEDEEEEPARPAIVQKVTRPEVPKLQHTQSYMDRAEDTWNQMALDAPSAFREESVQEEGEEEEDEDDEEEEDKEDKPEEVSVKEQEDRMQMPAPPVKPGAKPTIKPGQRPSDNMPWEAIVKPMQLTSSPLIFFNLACFQGTSEADVEVMHPICGYAVAGTMLSIMGPPGTDTSTLRVALSGMSTQNSREVLVSDFTVEALVHVAEDQLRTGDMDRNKPLIEILGLQEAAQVLIGTCIQRGARADNPEAGTPRGARNPEAPTPRKQGARTFPGSQTGLYKSVLLMEDLSTLLKADEIFKVVRVLNKVVKGERACALVTLNRPFERRGLYKMFDDMLYFTEEGVCYFGPTKGLGSFCNLISAPCPHNKPLCDHLGMISNIAAKYQETPLKKNVDQNIEKFTGAPPAPADETPRTAAQSDALRSSRRNSIPGLPKFKKRNKKHKDQVAEAFETEDNSPHAVRLARRLAEERRKMAEQQEAEEKLKIWRKLQELDSQPGDEGHVKTFEQMLLENQRNTRYNLPSCFMNLACFINMDDPTQNVNLAAVQPTVAFASEGCVLGVFGPQGSDAGNLMQSLKFGNDLTTIVTDLSVKDTIKMSEFVSNESSESENLDSSVEILMAKMMLTASAPEIIGSLIQRTKANATKLIEIGDQKLSTSTRSILILDRILNLDAQSLYVVLKLIRRIAAAARLAVVILLDRPEQKEGLFGLLDNLLVFNKEGVFFFGMAHHLKAYCACVDLPCPEDSHISHHVESLMVKHPPSALPPSANNLDTPFTVRYEFSALAKYNSRIINISTKPQEAGGNLSSRMLIPKSFRKKPNKADQRADAYETAELSRQKQQIAREAQKRREQEEEERETEYESALREYAKNHQAAARDPLSAGIKSICDEMDAQNLRPSLFFNLASFLADVTTDRIDILQPICGFALSGHLVGLMGPQSTDLTSFVQALTASSSPETQRGEAAAAPDETPRGNSVHQEITIRGVLALMKENDEAMKQLDKCLDTQIGVFLQRNMSADEKVEAENSGKDRQVGNGQSILIINECSMLLEAKELYAFIHFVKLAGPAIGLTTLVNFKKKSERRALFPLVDDVVIFDVNGISYFGPAARLTDYLTLVHFPAPTEVHPTDYIRQLMMVYGSDKDTRPLTDTPPWVRYKYSAIAEYVEGVAERFTGGQAAQDPSQPEGKKSRRKPYIPRSRRAKQRAGSALEEEMAAQRRQSIAEAEAEAERQRIAEAEAEAVWTEMVEAGS